MQLYGLKTCDSCRKARKALQNKQVEYIDVREGQVPGAVLEAALAKFGDALLNRASTTWRGLDEVARASDPLALLKANPTLMKRPLIVHDGQMGPDRLLAAITQPPDRSSQAPDGGRAQRRIAAIGDDADADTQNRVVRD